MEPISSHSNHAIFQRQCKKSHNNPAGHRQTPPTKSSQTRTIAIRRSSKSSGSFTPPRFLSQMNDIERSSVPGLWAPPSFPHTVHANHTPRAPVADLVFGHLQQCVAGFVRLSLQAFREAVDHLGDVMFALAHARVARRIPLCTCTLANASTTRIYFLYTNT